MHQLVRQSVIVFLLLIAASTHRQLVHSLNNLHLSSSCSSVAVLLQLLQHRHTGGWCTRSITF